MQMEIVDNVLSRFCKSVLEAGANGWKMKGVYFVGDVYTLQLVKDDPTPMPTVVQEQPVEAAEAVQEEVDAAPARRGRKPKAE